jgi:hypothetical protein
MLLVLAHAIATTAFSNLVLNDSGFGFEKLSATDVPGSPGQAREAQFWADFFAFQPPGATQPLHDPNAYARYLRASGIRHLRLLLPALHPDLPFQAATGFMGGTQYYLAAKEPAGYDLWNIAEGGGPHGITYLAGAQALPPDADFSTDMAAESARLTSVLADIAALADRTGYDNFAALFRRALALLTSPNATGGLLLAPAQYPLAARQIIDAAGPAWVFGGMGSWNDVYMEGDANYQDYERLSSELHTALHRAVAAAVNSL